ncbi:MAG: hypothetical protein DRQ40_09080 [Gammaproteobacteria bacterium]|nr:MAG: hypothetical protein DRQ40_09080 [Gammaproteobacteria bacterium]
MTGLTNASAANATEVGGGVSNVEAFTGSGTFSGSGAWNIDGVDTGTVGGVQFNFANLQGAAGVDDTFTIQNGARISGDINGGTQASADRIDISPVAGAQTVNLQSTTIAGVVGTFTGIEAFTGDNASDILAAPNGGAMFAVATQNDGTVGGIGFTDFANLTGGTGNDSFNLGAGVTGNLTGGDGDDAFNLAGNMVGGNVDGEAGTGDAMTGLTNASAASATEVSGGVSNVEAFTGSGTFSGSGVWNIDGVDTGTVNSVRFKFANLQGAAGVDDTFDFATGGSISGTVAGDTGTDTLDYADIATAVSVNLQTSAASLIGGFTGIEAITGGTGSDTLTGQNAANTWNITAANTGNIGGGFTFAGIESLIGGESSDTFNLAAGIGAVNGGAGADTVNIVGSYGSGADDFVYTAEVFTNSGNTITANSLTLEGATLIGSNPNRLLTSVNTLAITGSSGAAYIAEASGLTLSSINLGSGSLFLSAGGSITGTVSADALTLDAAGAITVNTNVNSLDASTSAGAITISETDNMILGNVDAGGNAVYLAAGGSINGGTFTGSSAEINAGTIGLTTVPTANVSTLTMTLTSYIGGWSGELTPGAALTTRPPDANISSVGLVKIGSWDYLATEADITAILASQTTFSIAQQELEDLLEAATTAEFFMTPPLEIYVDMEEDDEIEDELDEDF